MTSSDQGSLFDLVKAGDLTNLKDCVSESNINVLEDNTDMSMLMYSCICNHTTCVSFLLSFKNCDVNLCNRFLNTALMFAIEVGSFDIVKMLIENKSLIIQTLTARNKTPKSPIELATEKLNYYKKVNNTQQVNIYNNIIDLIKSKLTSTPSIKI